MKRILAVIIALVAVGLMLGPVVASAQPITSGKVIETMDSGGYTYLQIEDKGQKAWFAIPGAKVKKGDKVTLQPGMPMQNFESKSLKRTFDVIYFSGGLVK